MSKESAQRLGLIHEAKYSINELFFSVTDLESHIKYGNDAFYKVAEYSADELIGKPHNSIRNPAMPKAVFKLLWEYLRAGKGLCAYVVNRTKSGKYYWVFGIFSPVIDPTTGKPFAFISVRLKPQSERLSAIEDLYADVKDIEQAQGMDAAYEHLLQGIKNHGFTDYDAFVLDSMAMETKAFMELDFFTQFLARDSLKKLTNDEVFIRLQRLRKGIRVFNSGLKAVFEVKTALLDIRALLEETKGFFSLVRDSSMNLAIASGKLQGDSSRVLGPIVSELISMAESGETMMHEFERMTSELLDNHKALTYDTSKILFYSAAFHDDMIDEAKQITDLVSRKKAGEDVSLKRPEKTDDEIMVQEAISNVTLDDLTNLDGMVQNYVSGIQTLSDLVIRKLGYILILGRSLTTQGTVLAEGWDAPGVLNTLTGLQKDIISIESQLDNTAKNFNHVLNTMTILTDATKVNVAAYEEFSSYV